MLKQKLKDLHNSSIYFTPNFPVLRTKRYKLSIYAVFGVFLLFTAAVSFATFAVIAYTPIKEYLYIVENQELRIQEARTKELEKKLLRLANELAAISSAGKRMELAKILAITDTIDSTSAVYDSLKVTPKELIPGGGSLYTIFKKFINEYLQDESSYFINPCSGFIIKNYDPENGHNGIDYGIIKGTPVTASANGYVIFSEKTYEYGNVIMIQHNNDYMTVYKHCSEIIKKTREYVIQGETIALSGNTGFNTTGPHLHFEIWKNGKPINPKTVLINRGE